MKKVIYLLLSLTLFAACKKDDKPTPPDESDNYANGLVLLNEGLYQQNNASLSFYSFENNQVYTQAFFTENGRGLGDTANDFEKYTLDGKDYIIIAVDISSQIEIIEAKTLRSVAQIPLFDGSSAREPRRICVHDYAAYVCSFDGTVSVIDLLTYEVVKTIQVGANPDGMVQVGNELFVSNSGGLNFPVYDSTISVIDLSKREVTHTIDARINCTKMIVDSENEIYVLSNGNYGSVESALIRIDAESYTVIDETEWSVSSMTQGGDWIYYYDDDAEAVRKFNMLTEEFEAGNLIDCSSFQTFSGLQFVPELNLLFCFDANGYVNASIIRAYNLSGVLQYEFSSELNTKKIIFND
jgi:YVTN family beta-propeller protein